jgi:hypothetical protein
MGEATDGKVTEIDAVRRQLEVDLRELEERLPAPLRSVKSVGALLGGTALAALVLGRSRSKRSDRRRSQEVVVRVVRDDA